MGNYCCYRKKTSLSDYILFDKDGCSFPFCNKTELDVYNNMSVVRYNEFIYCSKECLVKHRKSNYIVLNYNDNENDILSDTI